MSKNWFSKILKVSSRSSLCPFFLVSRLCQRSALPNDLKSTKFGGWKRGELHNFFNLPQGLCKIPNEDNFSSWSPSKNIQFQFQPQTLNALKILPAEMESNDQHRKSNSHKPLLFHPGLLGSLTWLSFLHDNTFICAVAKCLCLSDIPIVYVQKQ